MNSRESTGSIPQWNKVYRLEDLDDWKHPGPSLAVLGHPIDHSLSPVIHNAALARMGQGFSGWCYFAFEIPVNELAQALPLFHKTSFVGLNLTIPHKVEALPLVSSVDHLARRMGAVNTLIREDRGFTGKNTDGYGIQEALRQDLDVELADAEVILLGAGGAARATLIQCMEAGCRKIWIGNRSVNRLAKLIHEVGGENTRIATFPLSSPPLDVPEGAVVINATSQGLKEGDYSPVDLSVFPQGVKVYDMIYNPSETALLREARDRGFRTANGLSMLVHQAARSLACWTGAEVPVEAMFKACASM